MADNFELLRKTTEKERKKIRAVLERARKQQQKKFKRMKGGIRK